MGLTCISHPTRLLGFFILANHSKFYKPNQNISERFSFFSLVVELCYQIGGESHCLGFGLVVFLGASGFIGHFGSLLWLWENLPIRLDR